MSIWGFGSYFTATDVSISTINFLFDDTYENTLISDDGLDFILAED